MSLEQQCRRKPDIEGIAVELRGGEKWLIPEVSMEPVFERENGQWIFKRLGVGEPFKAHYNRIIELWDRAAKKDSLPPDLFEELARVNLELAAMALDQNYDLTADQLGELIDPVDQKTSVAISSALRGVDLSKKGEDDTEPLTGDEKKKKLNG